MVEFSNTSAVVRADRDALLLARSILEGENEGKKEPSDCFLDFHHRASKEIRGNRISVLDRLPREFLDDVVSKWAQLYVAYYLFLKKRHPAEVGDHVVTGVGNPTAELSRLGLQCLSIASRYAEFWAEACVMKPDTISEFEDRLSFIGHDHFVKLHALRETDDLLVYDQRRLSLPVFDLDLAFAKAKSGWLWRDRQFSDYHIARLSDHAARTVSGLYPVNVERIGDVKTLSQGAGKISRCRYISSIVGTIAKGWIAYDDIGPIHILDVDDPDIGHSILQNLRARNEFCRILFSRSIVNAAISAFPNQYPIELDKSEYAGRAVALLNGQNTQPADMLCLDDWYFKGEDHSMRLPVSLSDHM